MTSYVGLAPRERSSALVQRTGAVGKDGCAMVRTLLVESAWAVGRGNPSVRKKAPARVPADVREHAHACSARLVRRRRELLGRGLPPCKANTAVAAEMARTLLFVGGMAMERARRAEAGAA